MNAKRAGYEFLIVIALLLVAVGVWLYKDGSAERAVAAAEAAGEARVAALTAAGESWAGALANAQAEAAFRGFAAGVHPLVLGGGGGLDQAIGALLQLPGVTFVHVLAADGAVVASSDRKLTTTGQVGEEGTWVLTAGELVSRGGEAPGTVELAAPVVGASGPAGYLWIGYAVEQARRSAQPADWPQTAAAPPTS